MIKFGGWDINVSTTGMPQKIASVLNDDLRVGHCKYKFVATLGSQQVNGTNYAILAQQTVLTGEDVNNAVVMVFNEKPDSMDIALTGVKKIVERGGKFGGISVNMSTIIPEEAMDALNTAKQEFVGNKIEPFAFIGTQITKGVNYILIAEVTPTALNGKTKIELVTVNLLAEKKLEFSEVFTPGIND